MSTADPFTDQIIIAGIDAAAQEMFDVLRRTAMSPIIYEVLDVGTGICDAKGNLVSSGAGIPSFIGVLDKSVKAILSKYGKDIEPGDVFITNDPNHGGVTHLNDMVVAAPVFSEDTLIAWVASIAHWGDIGGKTPGSMPTDVVDIFGEGLRLPNIKLVNKGKPNPAVLDIIETNSRLPDFVKGDLNAQIAAGRKANLIVRGIFEKYGEKPYLAAIKNSFQEAEARAIAGLKQLPKGSFKIEQVQDSGHVLKAQITITDDVFEVDLRGNPSSMRAPHNTSCDGAVIACQMFFKALTNPARSANAGSFIPLKVRTERGSLFDAGDMAPHGYYFETRIQLLDMLWQCMAHVMPDHLPAGHFASIFGTVIAGSHPDTGNKYTMVEPQMGGWGATSDRDGMSAMFSTSHGDTFNCPVEIAEARYGFEIAEKTLCENVPVSGFNTGGSGVRTKYILRSEATLSVGMSHAHIPVWSSDNAPAGGTNSLTVRFAGHDPQNYSFVSGLKLEAGDEILTETANGGYAINTRSDG